MATGCTLFNSPARPSWRTVKQILSSAGEIRQSAPGDFSFCLVLQPERHHQEMGRAGGCGQHTRNLVDTGAFGWLAAGAFVAATLAISPAQPIMPDGRVPDWAKCPYM